MSSGTGRQYIFRFLFKTPTKKPKEIILLAPKIVTKTLKRLCRTNSAILVANTTCPATRKQASTANTSITRPVSLTRPRLKSTSSWSRQNGQGYAPHIWDDIHVVTLANHRLRPKPQSQDTNTSQSVGQGMKKTGLEGLSNTGSNMGHQAGSTLENIKNKAKDVLNMK
jgi:hypothetical protein